MNARFRAKVLSDVVAWQRFVVRFLHGHGRIIVVRVNRYRGHLGRTETIKFSIAFRNFASRLWRARVTSWKPSGRNWPRPRPKRTFPPTPRSCAVRCASRRLWLYICKKKKKEKIRADSNIIIIRHFNRRTRAGEKKEKKYGGRRHVWILHTGGRVEIFFPCGINNNNNNNNLLERVRLCTCSRLPWRP